MSGIHVVRLGGKGRKAGKRASMSDISTLVVQSACEMRCLVSSARCSGGALGEIEHQLLVRSMPSSFVITKETTRTFMDDVLA